MAFTIRLTDKEQTNLSLLKTVLDKNTDSSTIKYVLDNYSSKCSELAETVLKLEKAQDDIREMKSLIGAAAEMQENKLSIESKLLCFVNNLT